MYFCAYNSLKSIKPNYVAPFLAWIDDESIDTFCKFSLFCLCADFIAHLRIFFQIPFCCKSWNRLCADDLEPYCIGKSIHLQPVINTNIIALIVILSSALGLPILDGFGKCDCNMFHCLSVSSVNCIELF